MNFLNPRNKSMTSIYIKINSIEVSNDHETIRPSGIFGGQKPGTMVAVRPCNEKYKNKTFLGMYLCDAPTGVIGEQVGDKIVLKMTSYTNPAIYIPEYDEIVWGYGSWWGEIKSEEHLKQISDKDIQDIWYVKALKQLSNQEDINI